jgi:hypothetical protein
MYRLFSLNLTVLFLAGCFCLIQPYNCQAAKNPAKATVTIRLMQEKAARQEKRKPLPIKTSQLVETKRIINDWLKQNRSENDWNYAIKVKPPDTLEVTLTGAIAFKDPKNIARTVVPRRGFLAIWLIPKEYSPSPDEVEQKVPDGKYSFGRVDAKGVLIGKASAEKVLKKSKLILEGDFIRNINVMEIPENVVPNQPGQVSVIFELNPRASKIFSNLTRKNIGRTLAITRNGEVISAAALREVVSDGRVQISLGSPSAEQGRQADFLRKALEVKPLPLPVEVEVNGKRVSLEASK